MQITTAFPTVPRAPGDDMWMVRATLTKELAPGRGDIVRFTAVDLDPDDTTPGVFPMLFEHGSLRRDAAGGWSNVLHEVHAWDGAEALGVASATYDAARAFLTLGIAPTGDGGMPVSEPDHLRLEIGDDTWLFTHDDAPAEAWGVLQAAMGVRELGAGRPVAA